MGNGKWSACVSGAKRRIKQMIFRQKIIIKTEGVYLGFDTGEPICVPHWRANRRKGRVRTLSGASPRSEMYFRPKRQR